MTRRLPLTATLAALVVTASPGAAFAQYYGNQVLGNPGASTPTPQRAGPPPSTWEPVAPVPPATRQQNPYPSCVTAPCNAPPIIRRPTS